MKRYWPWFGRFFHLLIWLYTLISVFMLLCLKINNLMSLVTNNVQQFVKTCELSKWTPATNNSICREALYNFTEKKLLFNAVIVRKKREILHLKAQNSFIKCTLFWTQHSDVPSNKCELLIVFNEDFLIWSKKGRYGLSSWNHFITSFYF